MKPHDLRGVKISLHKAYSTDGIELDSILFEPIKPTKKIVIHIHGKEGHFIQNHFVTVLGNSLPLRGFAFLTFNNRGHDYMADLVRKTTTGFIWEQGGAAFDIIENSLFDIEGVVNYVRDLGFKEIILQGHSSGPHKICYYLSFSKNHYISKVIFLSASDTIYLLDTYVPDWQKNSLLAKKMIDNDKGRSLIEVRLWSNCIASANTFWNYTQPESNMWAFNVNNPKVEFKNFNSMKLPILMIYPENDFGIGINPEKALEILRGKSRSINFNRHIIKNTAHNFLGKEEILAKVITDWLS